MEWSTTGKTPSEPHFENGNDYGGKLRRWQRSRVHGGRGLKTAAWRENDFDYMKSGHVRNGPVNEYDLGQRLVQLVEVDRASADAVAPPASESLYVPARAGEVLLVFLPDGWGDSDNNDNGNYQGSLRTVTDGSELVLGRAYGGDVSWTEAPENYFCVCASDDDKVSRSHVKLVSRDGSVVLTNLEGWRAAAKESQRVLLDGVLVEAEPVSVRAGATPLLLGGDGGVRAYLITPTDDGNGGPRLDWSPCRLRLELDLVLARKLARPDAFESLPRLVVALRGIQQVNDRVDLLEVEPDRTTAEVDDLLKQLDNYWKSSKDYYDDDEHCRGRNYFWDAPDLQCDY